jgi:Protein of unknown function (DUF3833)
MMPKTRAFALTEFFNGTVLAFGMFEDRFGTLRRRFEVEMSGRFEGETFWLTEHFRYDDGEIADRVWRIVPGSDGSFTATAGDIVGQVQATATPDTITMRYQHRIEMQGRSVVLSFLDRIFAMDAQTAFSRAKVSKFGIKVGEVTIYYRRIDAVVAAPLEPVTNGADTTERLRAA